MKRKAVFLVLGLVCACIGQQEPLTVSEWKNHLSIIQPPLGQDPLSMVCAVHNVDALPLDTQLVYEVESEGSLRGANLLTRSVITITVSDRGLIKGIHCTKMDVIMDMEMESGDETMEVTISGFQWVDSKGVPVTIEEDVIMKFGEYEIPMEFSVERTGESRCNGGQCWVLKGVQTTQIGTQTEENRILMYLDKESCAVVQTITQIGEEVVDTGYMTPPPSISTGTWELGDRESVDTESGTYDCQIIYLTKGSHETTIWANEKIPVPVKYTYVRETENVTMTIIMVLQRIVPGG